MNTVLISVVCVMTAVICRVLSRESAEFSSALSICAVIVIGAVIIYTATDILSVSKRLYDSTIADKQYYDVMIKGAGICLITKTASDCCRDCGENALAGAAETAGRLAMLITALPLFSDVLSLVEELVA